MNFIITQFPVILISIAYAFGIFISNYCLGIRGYVPFFISFGIILLIVIVEFFLKRRDGFKTFFMLSSIVVFSLFINSVRINKLYTDNNVINSEVIITKLFNSSDKYQNCIVEDILSSKKYLAKIKLRGNTKYKIGTKLFVEGDVESISSMVVPNNFNFSKYLKRRDVDYRLVVNNYIETTSAIKLSRNIEDKVDGSNLSNTSKGLMKALVLGRKDGIPDELLKSFSDSGIMHLLALSGLHIGILTIILTFLLKPMKLFKRGKLIRSLMVVLLLWFYAYITGFSSSIIRATIMFSIIVIGHGMRREINIFNSLSIAALVLLIINPNYLFDVGFQLSFSAVIGIVWIFPLLSNLWRPKHRVIRYFWSLLLVSISAQLATFPFTVYYFHKFSGLFFIANIIEIPLITILLGLSYLLLVLMLFKVELNLLDYIYDKTVIVIEWVSLRISDVESMVFNNLFIDQIIVVLLFALIISTIIFIQTSRVKYLYLVLIVVISIQAYSIFKIKETSSTQSLMMANDEILIQDGSIYKTSSNEGTKIFSNYTMANKLTLTDSILYDVLSFDNNYYWRVGENIDYNPIAHHHLIILGKDVRSNPEIIVNKNTVGIVYSGYRNSSYKTRWEYFCSKKDIAFYDVNNVLFNETILE